MEKEVLIFKNVYLIYFHTYALGVRCKICTFCSMPSAHSYASLLENKIVPKAVRTWT